MSNNNNNIKTSISFLMGGLRFMFDKKAMEFKFMTSFNKLLGSSSKDVNLKGTAADGWDANDSLKALAEDLKSHVQQAQAIAMADWIDKHKAEIEPYFVKKEEKTNS